MTATEVVHSAIAAHREWFDNADECQCGWNLQNPNNDPDVGEIGHVTHAVLTALAEAGYTLMRPVTAAEEAANDW